MCQQNACRQQLRHVLGCHPLRLNLIIRLCGAHYDLKAGKALLWLICASCLVCFTSCLHIASWCHTDFKLKTPQKDGTCSSDSLCWFIFSVLHGSLRLSTVSTNKKLGLVSLNIWIWWQTCERVRPPLFVIWICSERRTLQTHDVPSSVFNSQTTYMSINVFLLKLQVTGQGVHWERYTWAVRAYKEHGIRWWEESCRNILTKWRLISL